MPESVFNKMQVNALFRIDGQGGESYTEFSTVVISGNRTVIHAVSTSVECSPIVGGFLGVMLVWSRESPVMMMRDLPLPLDAMNLLANVYCRAELEWLEERLKMVQDQVSLAS